MTVNIPWPSACYPLCTGVVDQGCPARGDQEVEVHQDLPLLQHDQDEALSLHKPVDQVELHGDEVPSFPSNFG